MTVGELSSKMSAGSNMTTGSLAAYTSGNSSDDFIADGIFAKIVEESRKGWRDKRFSEKAISIIMEKCDKNGVGTGEGVLVPLAMFDRMAVPYKIESDGTIVRDTTKDIQYADGTAVVDWKRAENAEKFVDTHMGNVMGFKVKTTEKVRKWDNAAKSWSTTELRDQKVYRINWSTGATVADEAAAEAANS